MTARIIKQLKLATISLMLLGCQSLSTNTDYFTKTRIGEGNNNQSRFSIVGYDDAKMYLSEQIQLDIASNSKITNIDWTSTDSDIISVSSTGLMTATKEGNASITASSIDDPSVKASINIESSCVIDDIEELRNLPDSYGPLGAFTPTRFIEDSWQEISDTELADGANLIKIRVNLNNETTVAVNIVEVDLTKDVNIEAGSVMNLTMLTGKKAKIYEMAKEYEDDNPDRNVIAVSNADFFDTSSLSTNAFVKDGVILKRAHNDRGGYDYTNTAYHIPASMPMLFGVGNGFAQIGAIIDDATVKETIKSAFNYDAYSFSPSGSIIQKFDDVRYNFFSPVITDKVNFVTDSISKPKAPAGSRVYVLDPHDHYVVHGEITNIIDVGATPVTLPASSAYRVVVPAHLINDDIDIGDYFSYNLASEDGKWDQYRTILGSRQELVKAGQIAPTVTLENTNKAQDSDVPRTAVGVKPDGKVALFSVEALRYGGRSSSSSDPYGVSLPELAEIMRYYGIAQAGNLDGGGSTQLIAEIDGVDRVITRSSDNASDDPNQGRQIVNSFLVTVPK